MEGTQGSRSKFECWFCQGVHVSTCGGTRGHGWDTGRFRGLIRYRKLSILNSWRYAGRGTSLVYRGTTVCHDLHHRRRRRRCSCSQSLNKHSVPEKTMTIQLDKRLCRMSYVWRYIMCRQAIAHEQSQACGSVAWGQQPAKHLCIRNQSYSISCRRRSALP